MTAEIERPNDRTEGVIVAQGTQNGGYSWYIKDNRLVFDYNVFTEHHVVHSDQIVPTGNCMLGVKFVRDGRIGTIILSIDGKECSSISVPYILRMISSTGLDIGRDGLSPVSKDYKAPFKFTGTIKRVHVDLPRYRKPSQEREDEKLRYRTEMSKQ
jgi:arylsulfatase